MIEYAAKRNNINYVNMDDVMDDVIDDDMDDDMDDVT